MFEGARRAEVIHWTIVRTNYVSKSPSGALRRKSMFSSHAEMREEHKADFHSSDTSRCDRRIKVTSTIVSQALAHFSCRNVPATLPVRRVLDRMVGSVHAICARRWIIIRLEHVLVPDEAHTDPIHARLEEAIFTRIDTKEFSTILFVIHELFHGLSREDFDGAKESSIPKALQIVVLHIYGHIGRWSQCPQMRAKTIRKEDTISINFNGPIILQIQAIFLDVVHYFQEHCSVDDGCP